MNIDNLQESSEGEGTILILHYHFQPLTNIKTFIYLQLCIWDD